MTEGFPNLGDELRSSIRDNVSGDSIKVKHMVYQKVGSLKGCGRFWENHKIYSFRKYIHYGKYNYITL